MTDDFDFDKALEALQSGKAITGKDGVLTPLIKKLTEESCACPAHALAAKTAALAIASAALFTVFHPPDYVRAGRSWPFEQFKNSIRCTLFPAKRYSDKRKADQWDHLGLRMEVAAEDTQR